MTVTHPEITRYFMTIPEAAQLVLQASAMAKGGEVFVLDMGKPVKILDLAVNMVRLYGMTPFVDDATGNVKGDMPIVFSGLRPGEKLFEELLISESVRSTAHPRIMCADEVKLELVQVSCLMKRLNAACDNTDTKEVMKAIRDALPEFQSKARSTDLLALASSCSTKP